jgi:hypothetical protein
MTDDANRSVPLLWPGNWALEPGFDADGRIAEMSVMAPESMTFEEFKRQVSVNLMANTMLDEDRVLFGDLPGHPLALTPERAREMAAQVWDENAAETGST